MAKQIKQFRYYDETNKNNFPVVNTSAYFWSGRAFSDYMPTVHLGIQAPSGTKFYLNDGANAFTVGYTGIYEIDVEDLTEITSLRFDNDSLAKVANNPALYIIVDLIYEQEDE